MMDGIAGRKSGLIWAVHISVLVLVLLWLFPTVGPVRLVFPDSGSDCDIGVVAGNALVGAELYASHGAAIRAGAGG